MNIEKGIGRHTPIAVGGFLGIRNTNSTRDARVFRNDQTPFIVRRSLEGRFKISSTCRSSKFSYRVSLFTSISRSLGTGDGRGDRCTRGFREYQDKGGLVEQVSKLLQDEKYVYIKIVLAALVKLEIVDT